MPIRFRCVYCDTLLGIAKRKAGTVVNCTECGQPLIVPNPEPEAAPAAATRAPATVKPGASQVFESDDFDVILQGDATLPTPPAAAPRPQPARAPAPLPAKPFPVERNLPAPRPPTAVPLPAHLVSSGVTLSTTKLVFALGAVVFLMTVAFVGGILVGNMMKS